MKIYVKKIEGVTLPQRGSELAAGYDIVNSDYPTIVAEKDGETETFTISPLGKEYGHDIEDWDKDMAPGLSVRLV